MIEFELLHPNATRGRLGDLPTFLSEHDPRPAREQLDAAHGPMGGWRPFQGFRLNPDSTISYPGDPPQRPWARAQLRDEVILVYPADWVCIIQPDGTHEIARMS